MLTSPFISSISVLAVALLACSAAGGCTAQHRLQRFTYSQVVMGVRADIAVYSADDATAVHAARKAFAAMTALDETLSDYRLGNELAHVNSTSGNGSVRVSNDFGIVLNRSLEICVKTDGAFDPTVGPFVQLWRAARKTGRLPDWEEIEARRALTGIRFVSLSRLADGRFDLTLSKSGMRLDFGGIGKGFAADAGLAVLRQAGCPHAMVSVAGDIAAGSAPPNSKGWLIGLATGPGENTGETIFIENAGVSTSGDTEQYADIDGVRYSHIVDPRTGIGLVGAPVVTVVASDAATSDALATALCVLGPASTHETIQRFPGAECLVRSAAQSPCLLFVSARFPERVAGTR